MSGSSPASGTREKGWRARCGIFFSFVSPGRGRGGCSRSSWHRGDAGEEAEEELPASLTGPGRSYRKRLGPRGGGKAVPPPPKKKPWRVSRCPGSPACERGCVTDPLSAGYGERGGRSSLPLLVRHFGDVSVRFLEQAGIPLPPGPSAPSRSVTRSGNFITRLGTMPRSQEGCKPNQWTGTKCRTSLVGPRFLHPAWACSPGAALPSWSGTTSPCLLVPSGPERRGDPGGVWAGLALLPGGILRRTTL